MTAPDALRRRLLARVQDSVHAHREYATVRADGGVWCDAGPDGAQVYARQRLAAGPALESHWWTLAEGRARRSAGLDRRWLRSAPGVEVLRLWGDARVVSMLVRFDAGASVPDHGHDLDEDCLVLDGEMFLGDILLRAGDYQLAPAGGTHWGEMSDVGCVFFFHGAIDPVLNTRR
jgi:quercetin dioxygenase-like cupin family protein